MSGFTVFLSGLFKMKTKCFRFSYVALLLLCSGQAGCQKLEAPPLVQVKGEVVNGEGPVVGARVEFHPDQGRSSSGMTDERGQFSLRYTVDHKGALPGFHTVHFLVPPQGTPEVPGALNEHERKEFLERNRQPVKIQQEERVEVSKSHSTFRFDLAGKKSP